MIELYLVVNELREKYLISINVFDIDENGGLKPLRSFILLIVSSYFIFVTMFIIETLPLNMLEILENLSLANLSQSLFLDVSVLYIPFTNSMITVSLMLLLGLMFFIITQQVIRNLIDQGVKSELQKINMKFKETYDKIIEISSNKKNNDNKKDLEELRMILDLLEREEQKIKEINHKRFDLKTISTFITTFLLPIITASLSAILSNKPK